MNVIKTNKIISTALLSSFLSFTPSLAEGTLSENIRIESEKLGYALQYRVYTPEGMTEADNLPTIYMTDGGGYINNGMTDVLDREINEGNIKPVIAIFVDARNPDNPSENRRNKQFFCNQKYVDFYEQELLPKISNTYPASNARDDRVILGLSFGAYNAACFGLMANKTFKNIAMNSPANTNMVNEIGKTYGTAEKLPLKIFMSVGTKRDNTKAGQDFHKTLKNKGYDLTYIEVPFGHSWKNWKPLMDDVLITFFGTKK